MNTIATIKAAATDETATSVALTPPVPSAKAVEQHRHEGEVPGRPGQREPDVQAAEVVILAQRPAHLDRPCHRWPCGEPAEEVDHVQLAENATYHALQRIVAASERNAPSRRHETSTVDSNSWRTLSTFSTSRSSVTTGFPPAAAHATRTA
jgi:hypothetical protein